MSEIVPNLPKIDRFEPLEFRGSSKEYFKIWIVNIFLSIITLGIYSAWAKVRTNRYFYANTYLKESSFEYIANPKSILKGRVILFCLYAVFIFSSQIWLNPIITIAVTLSLIFISPWIVNRAIKFQLKNTKYRNINFHYDENVTKFYSFFSIHLILNIVTLTLAYPYTLHRFKHLLINNSSYGDKKFDYEAPISKIYGVFLKMIFTYFFSIVLPMTIIFMITLTLSKSLLSQFIDFKTITMLLSTFLYIVTAFGLKGLYEGYIKNYIYNNTTLDNKNIKFHSTLDPNTLAWLYISNIFFIVISLGYLTPWTKVRTYQYKCKNTKISAQNLEEFSSLKTENPTALAEESEDFFDLDIGI
jgi:uncharacterized membrane protein YjgN (DUF898 family)